MSDTPKQHQVLMAFDYGIKQIGVAIAQTLTGQARPLCQLKARDGIPDWQQIQKLLDEWQPDALIVGLPLNMDGSHSPMCARAQKFSRRLHGRFNIIVHTQDERLSTFAAKELQEQLGTRPQSYRDNPVDSLAATIILQDFLQQHHN